LKGKNMKIVERNPAALRCGVKAAGGKGKNMNNAKNPMAARSGKGPSDEKEKSKIAVLGDKSNPAITPDYDIRGQDCGAKFYRGISTTICIAYIQ
jgi:hypothetical protein